MKRIIVLTASFIVTAGITHAQSTSTPPRMPDQNVVVPAMPAPAVAPTPQTSNNNSAVTPHVRAAHHSKHTMPQTAGSVPMNAPMNAPKMVMPPTAPAMTSMPPMAPAPNTVSANAVPHSALLHHPAVVPSKIAPPAQSTQMPMTPPTLVPPVTPTPQKNVPQQNAGG
ncbi:MAG TPA: hypothetical protein VEW28_07685 [Candidatus Kapabacteria bacterium]|nr:hypothetical protein [Candidatus Kapabacteria bacterium]